MFKIKKGFFLIIFCLSNQFVKAQAIAIDILQQGTTFTDSSYYDILKVDDTNYWLFGKYGIISNYNAIENKVSCVKYPSENEDIYRVGKFSNEKYIACADKGTLYFFNPVIGNWSSRQIKGFENSCFYNVTVVDENTALICGGRSAIAHSAKTIPDGFIIRTADGGKTWTKVYSSTFKMVWALRYNEVTKNVAALIYSPGHTSLYSSSDGGNTWSFAKKIGKGIYYDLEFDKQNNAVCFGGKIGGSGKLVFGNDKKLKFKQSGLIWSKVQSGETKVMTACNGNLLFSKDETNWELIHTELNKKFSLYRAEFISPDKIIVVGSARTILIVNISEIISSNSE